MPPGSRRAVTTPASAVRVSRSPPCQPSALVPGGYGDLNVSEADSHLTNMIDISLTTEFVLNGSRRWPRIGSYGGHCWSWFADDLAAGRVPSVRAIRTRLHAGQPRAQRAQAHLTSLTAVWPAGTPLVRPPASGYARTTGSCIGACVAPAQTARERSAVLAPDPAHHGQGESGTDLAVLCESAHRGAGPVAHHRVHR